MPTPTRTAALLALAAALAVPAFARAQDKPAEPPKPAEQPPVNPRRPNANRPNAGGGQRLVPADLYERVSPSLVAVKYTWNFELGRQELAGAGVVVSAEGLVACPLTLFSNFFPDAQMKDFKIVVPSKDGEPDEVDAEFVGRDERTNLAFIRPAAAKAKQEEGKGDKEKTDKEKTDKEKTDKEKTDKDKADKEKPRAWTPVKFEDVAVKVGEPVWSVGVLSESAGFRAYLMEARVSAALRGETAQVLVTGDLSGVGSPVFNARGQAVGFVHAQTGQMPLLNDPTRAMSMITSPPRFFTPSSEILLGLTDPPTAGKPMELPWLGVVQMAGVTKDVAEAYNLGKDPGVQIGDVVPDGPAAKAGIKQGDIIVKIDGKAIDRGDEPEELPAILRKVMVRKKVGSEVALTVVRKVGEPPQDIKVKLASMPKQPNVARRAFFEDLGFGVREMVFSDTYGRHLPADAPGVVVSVTKPQGAAQSGGLAGDGSMRSDVIVSLNGQPVKDLPAFEKLYRDTRKAKAKDPVVLVVRREGREDTVRVEPPQ